MNVIVTGAGGSAGVCVIKGLRNQHRVIATDTDPLAAGLYLADRGYTVPRSDDPRLVPRLLTIARAEDANVLVPTVQEELPVVARNRTKFERKGVVPIVSGEESLTVASDKRLTYSFFRGESYCPKVYTRSRVEFPAVVKPVSSRGGRGFQVCRTRAELRVALERNARGFGESVIMEYVPGTEFSVYGLSGSDGSPIVTVPIRRIEAIRESKKAEIVKDRRVQSVAAEVAGQLGLVGPWNVQLMRVGRRVVLIEVNPRFAGTVALIIAAGVNLPELALKAALGKPIASAELRFRDRLLMTRYNEEIFLTPGEVVRQVGRSSRTRVGSAHRLRR